MTRETLAPLRHRRRSGSCSPAARSTRWATRSRPIALAFAVLDLTGSATDLGLVVGARTLVNVAVPALRRRARRPAAEAPADGRLVRRRGRHPGRGRRARADRHRHDPAADRARPRSTAWSARWPCRPRRRSSRRLVPADLRQQANALSRLFFNGAAIIGAPVGRHRGRRRRPGLGHRGRRGDLPARRVCFGLVQASRRRYGAADAEPSRSRAATSSPTCGPAGPSSSPAPGCGWWWPASA